MKLIHLSDLHLGKRVNGFSMIEDQKYILAKILNAVDEEEPDAIIIAGDVYDKSVPSAEAVELFDDFLVRLSRREHQVFIVSGNHDSAERLAFGNRLIDASGIHIAPVYDGHVEPFVLRDEHGPVNIYMLPFIKPSAVRRFFPEEHPEGQPVSYTDAVRTAIKHMDIGNSAECSRNILIAHQFVTGASRSDSEDISVGGLDNVDADVFDMFDYVALGHIHGPQNITKRIRYCGTPLKYSFSEINHEKSITVAEIGARTGNAPSAGSDAELHPLAELRVRTIPLEPIRDMVELKGKYDELTLRSFYENTTFQEDYVHIVLIDEEDIPDAIGKLRAVYHNLMKLDYDNTRTRHASEITGAQEVEEKTPLQLFGDLYELQNGMPMSPEQSSYVESLIEKIWEK